MPIAHPTDYAVSKAATLRSRLQRELGDAVRRWGPELWPAVPTEALIGLTASSTGQHETGTAPDYACGYWGVEREALPGLVGQASALLHREVASAGESRAFLDDVEGQTVVGLLNYRRHLTRLRTLTPSKLWTPDGPITSWHLRCAAAAYSSGPRVLAAALTEWGDELAALPPSERWPACAQRVVDRSRVAKRVGDVRIAGKWKLAFCHLRAEQRLACGLVVGAPREWVAPWMDGRDALVRELRRLADFGAVQ